MSIEGQHAYRFGYLKSEQWKTVRVEALAREKGKCQICGEESISNDAHHIWYPANIYETTERHLVILCRPCHDFLHTMLPECKTRDEETGIAQWNKFRSAIIVWKMDKSRLFDEANDMDVFALMTAKDLRIAYDALRKRTYQQCPVTPPAKPKREKTPSEKLESVEKQIESVLKTVKRWSYVYRKFVKSVNGIVDDDAAEK